MRQRLQGACYACILCDESAYNLISGNPARSACCIRGADHASLSAGWNTTCERTLLRGTRRDILLFPVILLQDVMKVARSVEVR